MESNNDKRISEAGKGLGGQNERNHLKPISPAERQKVMGRIAAVESFTVNATEIFLKADTDIQKAHERIANVFQIQLSEALHVCNVLVGHLKQGELTINFHSDTYFKILKTGEMMNGFQTGHFEKEYMISRDKGEEALFNYKNSVERVIQLGSDPNNNTLFEPGVRPRYAALNFDNARGLGMHLFGRSYMVLKDHVKLNCTFTAKDSGLYYELKRPDVRVASYYHLHRLIIFMTEKMLIRLHNAAMETAIPVRIGNSLSDYIEAQMHTSIMLNRDVKRIYVSRLELSELQNKRAPKFFELFKLMSGIQIEYI